MSKPLKNFPNLYVAWGELLMEIGPLPDEEVKTHIFDAYKAWMDNRIDDLPQWAKSGADHAIKKSDANAAASNTRWRK